MNSSEFRIRAEVERVFGPVTPAALEAMQREVEEHEQIEALLKSHPTQDQIKVALDALKMADMLRSFPLPESGANHEYLEAMTQISQSNKLAMQRVIAAEVKRQLESRDDDEPNADEGKPS